MDKKRIIKDTKRISQLMKINEVNLVKLSQTNFPNVKIDNDATQNDSVNAALLQDLQTAAQAAGVVVTITTAKSGHPSNTSGKGSRHQSQTAVDIAIINGVGSGGATNSKNGNAQFREAGNKMKDALMRLGYTLNAERGQTKAVLWHTNLGGNHYNHLHVSNTSGSASGGISNYNSNGATNDSSSGESSPTSSKSDKSTHSSSWNNSNDLKYLDFAFTPLTKNIDQKKENKEENFIKNKNINESTLGEPVPYNGNYRSNFMQRRQAGFAGAKSAYNHKGDDIAIPSGTPVKAPADGKITQSAMNRGACGGTIDIDHGNGFKTRFCHIRSIDVKVGDVVKKGDKVGESGGGKNDPGRGRSTGPHLHWTLLKNGSAVDPMAYVNKPFAGGVDYGESTVSGSNGSSDSSSSSSTSSSSDTSSSSWETGKDLKFLDLALEPITNLFKSGDEVKENLVKENTFVYPIGNTQPRINLDSIDVEFQTSQGKKVYAPYNGIIKNIDPNTCNGLVELKIKFESEGHVLELCGVDCIVNKGDKVHQGEHIGYTKSTRVILSAKEVSSGKKVKLNKFYNQTKSGSDEGKHKKNKDQFIPSTGNRPYDITNIHTDLMAAPFNIATKILGGVMDNISAQNKASLERGHPRKNKKDEINEDINKIKRLLK